MQKLAVNNSTIESLAGFYSDNVVAYKKEKNCVYFLRNDGSVVLIKDNTLNHECTYVHSMFAKKNEGVCWFPYSFSSNLNEDFNYANRRTVYDFQLMISIGSFCYYRFSEVDRTFGFDDDSYVEMCLYEDEIECFGANQDDWVR